MNINKRLSASLCLFLAGAWSARPACAQGLEQVIKSFGTPGASYPEAGLLQGSDGGLYGTSSFGGATGNGTVFRLGTNGSEFVLLYSFKGADGDGSAPFGGLIQGADGALYGTTQSGGTTRNGTVFKLNTNGSGYQVLYSFTGIGGGDGALPYTGVVQGKDGALYGTCAVGGINDGGTVFKVNTNGSDYTVLLSFTGVGTNGGDPEAALIQGSDGALYGTTLSGGPSGGGTVFRLNTDGSGYQMLYGFTGDGTNGDGLYPQAALIQGADGALYGTTSDGGAYGFGTVFTLSANGSGYSILYSFTNGSDGARPLSALVQGADGTLYGTTLDGGAFGFGGTVFKLGTDGSGFTVLHNFNLGRSEGARPFAGLILGNNSALYGTTHDGGTNDYGTVFTLSTNGSAYSMIYSLPGPISEGAYPDTALVQGTDGALYGTLSLGGPNNDGAIFKLNTDGLSYSVIYSFTGGADGAVPMAGLIQGADGALYGTSLAGTSAGGSNAFGKVFTLSTNGSSFTVLHSFTGLDGFNPVTGLIQGTDGALYGTAQMGVTSNGMVFKLNTNGSGFTLLHSFTGGADGATPGTALIQGTDGALYGTAANGGAYGLGVVFTVSTGGTGYNVLHSFTGGLGDSHPQGRLIQGADGALYGTTYLAGLNTGFSTSSTGTVFTLSTSGTGYAVLHSFSINGGGGKPVGLIQGADGALYGTTSGGSIGVNGTVFRLSTNGSGYSVLYTFTGGADGLNPMAGLIQGTDGALYGTTHDGGVEGVGTVFRISPTGQIQISQLLGRNIQVSCLPPLPAVGVIGASTDLLNWTTLTNVPAMSGPVSFEDVSATNYPQRFYRAIWSR